MFAVWLLLCRNWRYEQELASLLWKVEMKDVAVFRTTALQYGSSLNLSRVGPLHEFEIFRVVTLFKFITS